MKIAFLKVWIILLITLLLLNSAIMPDQVSAQEGEEPIELPYRLGQGSVGDSGTVAPTGVYVSSVPFDLPQPRGDLPFPLAVVYTGGNRVGEVGVGWSIPLSYVRRSLSLSQRKPAHLGPASDDKALPKPAPRLFLDLGSGPMLMAETDTEGVYRPFVSTTYIDLTETSDGWVAVDSAGRQYTFSRIIEPDPNPGIPHLSTELGDENLWLLTRITDRTGKNWISLQYQVFDMIPPPPHEMEGNFTIKELVLHEIAYSFDLSGTCPKHRLEFQYKHPGSTTPYPKFLDLSVSEGHLRARTRILDRIKIWSQATPECTEAGRELLRSYRFQYSDDIDTGQPRLTSVNVFGRGDDGSDEATGLPVARYGYGTATSDESLAYGNPRIIVLPEGAPETDIGFSLILNTKPIPLVNDHFNLQYLMDLTGDGRADYLYPNGPFFIENLPPELRRFLLMAANVPSSSGDGTSTFPSVISYTTTNVVDDEVPISLGNSFLGFTPGGGTNWVTDKWQQLIDWNGDGRIDILRADRGKDPNGEPSPDYWRVLLNTPGSSSAPGDIEWVEAHVDISYLRASARRPDGVDLSLMRSQTTYVRDRVTREAENGRVTEWRLLDVNGDSYPDFVFNQLGVRFTESERCDDSGECHPVGIVDIPQHNKLMVIYHTGPLMAGAGAPLVSRWAGPAVVLRENGASGVERFKEGPNHTEHMTAGFLEMNGDGIVDHVIEESRTSNGEEQLQRLAIRSSGLPQQIDQELPENQIAWPVQERGRAMLLPGPVNVVETDRKVACPRDPNTGELQVAGQTPYFTRMLSTLRDLTGDGIADYIFFGTRTTLLNGLALEYPGVEHIDDTAEFPNWWVMIGTGTGFVPPRPIAAPLESPFEIYTSREQCDGLISRTFKDLIDLDGDGRLDIVRTDDLHRIVVAQLVGGTSGAGAHDAGRLVREANGYGAANLISYGSAKADFRTEQQVPFEQIVVTEIKTVLENGLGVSLEPIRYAYGDAQLHYQPLLGRWIFPGYGRRVVLQGLPDPEEDSRIQGTALVFEALSAEDLSTGYERHALTGSLRDTNYLVGDFAIDPRELLDGVAASDSRWRGNRHIEYDVKLPADPGPSGPVLVPLNQECYDLNPLSPPPAMGDLHLCERAGIAYQAELTDWQGTSPFPAADSVATRTSILPESVDDFGRATLIKFANDRSRADDDVCAVISYASNGFGSPRVLDAVHFMRFQSCQNSTLYSGVRYLYDNLPEGQVGIGLITGQITERYDTLLGQKLEEYQLDAREYDDYGNLIRLSLNREDGVTSTFETTFDAFGVAPEQSQGTASDVSVSLINNTEYDPISLLPISDIDANGRQFRTYYDHFGRIEKSTVQLPGDPEEYALATTEYLADQGTDPQGRRVRERIFRKWTPASIVFDEGGSNSLAVTEVIAHYDELGRQRYQETDLGADYTGGSLVTGYVEYDGLGRPSFIASSFQSRESSNTVYGTTYQYFPDGRLKCVIQGEGLQQGAATADEIAARYPTCFTYSFENFKGIVRSQGPNELLPESPQAGAFDEAAITATGRTLWRSRWRSGKRLEHTRFDYDRLGQLTSVSRYAAPDSLDGPVTWKIRNDSLGQILSVEEPAAAVRSYKYDHWGNLTEIFWIDSTVIPAVDHSILHTYDGFGRLINVDDTEGGVSNADHHVEYFYDQASGETAHLNANNLIGRLSYTRDSVMSAYFGYDGLGQRTSDTRVHLKDGEQHSTVSQLGPFGTLEELTFLLPDVGYNAETVNYTYDSAGRARSISRTDATGTEEIWSAKSVDAFGRYLEIELGNGVTQHFDYRPNRRRELTGTQLRSGDELWEVAYQGYDGQMLLTGLVEHNTVDGNTLTTAYTYDTLYRLARAKTSSSSGMLNYDEAFQYDGLGNIVQIIDNTGPNDLSFIMDSIDRDRILQMTDNGPSVYNYQYDAMGNVTRIADGSPSERFFEYDVWSRVVCMGNEAALASTRYDAFGEVVERIVTGLEVGKNRIDQHYGGLIEKATFPNLVQLPMSTEGNEFQFQNGHAPSLTITDHNLVDASACSIADEPVDSNGGNNIYLDQALSLQEGVNIGQLAPHSEHWYTFTLSKIDDELMVGMPLTMFFTPGEPNIARYVTFEIFTASQYDLWKGGRSDDMQSFGAGSWVSRDGDYNTGERLWHGALVANDQYFVKITNGTNERIDYYLINGDISNIEMGLSYVERRIPGPSGIVAVVRHTNIGQKITLYPHGDFTANRLVTGEAGQAVQDATYRPFGELITDTGADNPNTFMKHLWNGGETYEAFGITHLGSRIYEPHTGRFLQRDPLFIPRSASRMNPYAFAFNDPINFTDLLGLDPCDELNPVCGGVIEHHEATGGSWEIPLVVATIQYALNQEFPEWKDQSEHRPRTTARPLPLPEIDHSRHVGHGFVYQAYSDAKRAAANSNNSRFQRGVSGFLTVLAAPLAWGEEYIGRPIANVPYFADIAGQYIARGTLQKNTYDKVEDFSTGIGALAVGFNNAASVGAPISARGTQISTGAGLGGQGGGGTGPWWRAYNFGPNHAGTMIPKGFYLEVGGQVYRVHPHATKHMIEIVRRQPGSGNRMFPISSLAAAVEQAQARGLAPGPNFLIIGNWELGIDTTNYTIYHALYRP